MRRAVGVVALAATLLLAAGCWDHREIVDLVIVTGIGIDRGTTDESIRLTLQAGKTPAGQGSGEEQGGASLILEAAGRSMSAALQLIRSKSSREPYLQHNQVLLISREQAEQGFFSHLDTFTRELELRLEVWLAVSEGDASQVLHATLEPEQLSGIALARMMLNEREIADCRAITLIEYITKKLDGVTASTAPIVTLMGPEDQPSLAVTGMAVFQGGRMTGRLTPRQVDGYAWLSGGVKSRVLEMKLPQGYAVVQLVNLKTQAKPVLQQGNDEILLEVSVDGQFAIGELQGFEQMEMDGLAQLLEQEAAAAIAEEMRDCFEYTRSLGADILGLGASISRRHPARWAALEQDWEARYRDIKLQPHVTLEFMSPGALREGLDMRAAR